MLGTTDAPRDTAGTTGVGSLMDPASLAAKDCFAGFKVQNSEPELLCSGRLGNSCTCPIDLTAT